MGLMKDYLMTLEELAYDALAAGAVTDEEICGYIRNYFPVEMETVKEVMKKISSDWLDNSQAASYNQ